MWWFPWFMIVLSFAMGWANSVAINDLRRRMHTHGEEDEGY